MPTTVADWAIIVGLPLTIAQTLYVALTYHSSKVSQAAGHPARTSYRHLLIMSVLAVISWSLFAAEKFLGGPKILFADAVVNDWSYQNGEFHVGIRGDPLLEFKDDDDLVLNVKPPIPGADYMTDPHGIKSSTYSIHQGMIYMVARINKEFCSFFARNGGVEMIVVLLPKKFSSEQISSISSIDAMGGKIIGHPGWPMGYPPPECNSLK
jgi:nitrogen fixation protein